MASLLHYMRSCIKRLIEDSKARMQQLMHRKIKVIHNCLDVINLRILYRSAPTIDLSTSRWSWTVFVLMVIPSRNTRDYTRGYLYSRGG